MQSATKPIPELTESEKERFWKFVNKEGPIIRPELGPCWEWLSHRSKKGYGRFKIVTCFSSHRVSFFLRNGQIPVGICVLHRCDNPPCVNPAHLFSGTIQDNTDDMIEKGRAKFPKVLRGDLCPNSRLREVEVVLIRVKYSQGQSMASLASEFSVSPAQICSIVNGKSWKSAAGPLTNSKQARIRKARVGESNNDAKLTNKDVLDIRKIRGQGISCRIIGIQFGVSTAAIWRVVNRITWKHI